MPLTDASSTEDCVAWLKSSLPDSFADAAAAGARQHSLSGQQLLSLTEDGMADKLGIVKFGVKRKLTMMLKDAKEAAAKAPKAAAASASEGRAASPEVDAAGRLDQAACDAQLGDECHALGLTRWAGESLHKLLTAPENAAWASKAVKEARLGSLQALRAECELPRVSIVVVGNTGAGKSTLLNALLDETRVLPTNGMRACTASLIEMRHEASDPARDPLYRGEVEFLTQAEWDKELPDLLDDLTPNDGPNAGRVNIAEVQPDNPAYDSWCRVYSVYGDIFKHSRERSDERGPDGKPLYKNPTLESLKAKLRGARNITHAAVAITAPYPGWEYDRARENASCFHCGRRGHYSDKCPAKREGYRRVWLAVKFHEKEEAKRSALKAKWCGDTKRWYTFRSLGFTKRHFSKWRPCYA